MATAHCRLPRRPRTGWRHALAWGLVAGCGLAAAQDAAQRVEISAQPLSDTEQRRREPVARTIVGRDEIEKYGDTSVSDVLKRLPGLTVSGGSPRLRGLGSGYTLLLINGDPAPPGFSLDDLTPGQVERIEVTRGATADRSAQAVAGTVNLVLREAPRVRQRELRATVSRQVATPALSGHASWGDQAGALRYTLPLSFYQWRNQADTLGERQTLDAAGQPQQLRVPGGDRSWGHGFNLGPRGAWQLGAADRLELSGFFQRSDYRSDGAYHTAVLAGQPPPSVDDRFGNRGFWSLQRLGLAWTHQAADGGRLELRAGGQTTRSRSRTLTDGFDAAGLQTLARDTHSHNREWSGSSSGKWSQPVGEARTLAFGWDLEQRRRRELRSVLENGAEQLQGYEGEPFHAEVLRSALYLQDEWALSPAWSTYLGLRAERLATRSADSDGSRSHQATVWSPVLHLTHRLDARGRSLLRASLTRSYKAPELGQLVGRPSRASSYALDVTNTPLDLDRIGNPALRPELATGLDLAWEHYLPQGGVLSVGVFHKRIRDLIRQQVTLQTVPWATAPRYVGQPVNLAGARTQGLELELKGRADELMPAGRDAPRGLALRSALSLYRSAVDGLPGPDNRLEQQPAWQASLGFDHSLAAPPGGLPLTLGASLGWVPGVRVLQEATRSLVRQRVRTLDAYALLVLDRGSSLRLGGSQLLADGSADLTETVGPGGEPLSNLNTRSARRRFSASLLLKF